MRDTQYFHWTSLLLTLLASIAFFSGSVRAIEEEDPLGPVIGIDLGKSYSRAAIKKDGVTKIFLDENGNKAIPSYVAWTDDGVLVGAAAKDQYKSNPSRTVFGMMNFVGRNFNDQAVQDELDRVPFKVVSVKDKPRVSVKVNGEQKTFAAEEVIAQTISKLADMATSHLGEPAKNAVITVPGNFNDNQRAAVKDAGTLAGLNVLRIMDEPRAVALSVEDELYKFYSPNWEDQERFILVCDMGSTSFDVTGLSVDYGVYEMEALASDIHLGAHDFDRAVAEYFMPEYKSSDIDLSGSLGREILEELASQVEESRRTLTNQPSAVLNMDIPQVPGHPRHNLEPWLIEATTKDLLERAEILLRDVLVKTERDFRGIGRKANDFDAVLLVGGGSSIPGLRGMIEKVVGKKVMQSEPRSPDEAVVYGAALQASVLSGEYPIMGSTCGPDVTPLSLGIESAGGVVVPIIKRGTTIPTRKSQTFSTIANDQKSVAIRIHEGERVFAEDNLFLAELSLEIDPAPKGIPQLEVFFDLDANGVLKVAMEEQGSTRDKVWRHIQEGDRIDWKVIDQMLDDAETHFDRDEAFKKHFESRIGERLLEAAPVVESPVGSSLGVKDESNMGSYVNDKLSGQSSSNSEEHKTKTWDHVEL